MTSKQQRGSVLPTLIVFMMIVGIIATSVGGAILVTLRTTLTITQSEMAFNIADAGVNYYLWHMNHNTSDYKDGTTTTTLGAYGYGPFVHDYKDFDGNVVGTYTLYVKPPDSGSSVITVRSIGQASASNEKRTIVAQIGAPSFATYGVTGNSALWFGNTETANGPVMSNIGIKMDGANTDTVSSAQSTYTVPASSGNGSNTVKPGVWCDTTITAPVNCNTRNKSSWVYPVPSVDFNALSANMCDLKKLATGLNVCNTVPASRTAGYVPPVNQTSYSATVGYLISLNDDGTYNLEKVTNENDTKATYAAALTKTAVQSNIAIPTNGIIFVEDNVWLRTSGPNGFTGRVTIVSARLAVSGDTTVVIADDVAYKDKYVGTTTIGAIAENNVEIAPYASVPVELDGAYIAKAGGVGIRQKYRGTSTYVKGYVQANQGLTFYGALASNTLWTWSVSFSPCANAATNPACWAGYEYTNTTYDARLRYSPPPSFPITSTYDILSWREVVTNP